MSENRWSLEDWIGIAVRLFFGALLGALVGVSWVWWVSPVEHAAARHGLDRDDAGVLLAAEEQGSGEAASQARRVRRETHRIGCDEKVRLPTHLTRSFA